MITVTHKGDRYEARFPYNPDAITFVKNLRFRWDPSARCWWTKDELAAKAISDPYALAEYNARAKVETDVGKEYAAKRLASVEASRATDAAVTVPSPAGLDYLPYQRAGIAYAMDRDATLIGDEMGLGKTIQAIGIANADAETRRVLIICPASLKLNWKREWNKWDVKGLSVAIANGKWSAECDVADVVIVNYENVRKHRSIIDARDWDLLIVDECHYLKNPKAQRTVAVLGQKGNASRRKEHINGVKARRRVFMTGTPVVNRPIELWPLVEALDPTGMGRSFFTFVKRYCNAYEGAYGWDFSGASNLDELQIKLRAACMVRRLKADVLRELPPKRRQVVHLTSPEIVKAVGHEGVTAKRWEDLQEELAVAEALALVDDRYKEEVRRLEDLSEVAFEEMSATRHEVALAKVPAMIEYITDALESLECLVVMVHHRDVAERLAAAFAEQGSVLVHGQIKIEDRQAAVDKFQSGEVRVFVGTIRAAGVGLTLTRASTIIFGELDWVPGNVSQAEDRIHRIGQVESVLVQHLVADGSIDARMAHILVAKQAVIDKALDVGADHEAKLAVSDHQDIVAPKFPDPAAKEAALRKEFAERRYQDKVSAAFGVRKIDVERLAKLMTPEQIAAVHAGLRLLTELNPDGAMEKNFAGFNKADTTIGSIMASRPELNASEAVLGMHILRKYRRQIDTNTYERIFG